MTREGRSGGTRLTVNPNVSTSSDGEAEEESDEDEGLEVSSGDGFSGEDHGSDELTLGCTETGSQDDGEASSIGGWRRRERRKRLVGFS